MRVASANDGSVREAGLLLSRGRLVAFPTETVFGLGCDASSEEAVDRLYRVKGRARGNPLIVHVSSMEEAERWGVLCCRARLLAQNFWAGGLTLVVPYRGDGVAPRGVVTDVGSVALRVPSHWVALSLLDAFGGAIAAPSANRSGCVSATSAEHVVSAFSGLDEPALVLDSVDVCETGIESTVVSFMSMGEDKSEGESEGCVLRLGAVSVAEMEGVLGEKLLRGVVGDKGILSSQLSPGLLGRHYAPRLPLRLNALGRLESGEAFLGFGDCCEGADMNLSMGGDCVEAARNLYRMLQALDDGRYNGIAVARVAEEGMGEVVNDRLRRAAMAEES